MAKLPKVEIPVVTNPSLDFCLDEVHLVETLSSMIKKLTSILLLVSIMLYQVILPGSLVLAQEVTPDPTPETTSEPTPETTPETTPSPSPEESVTPTPDLTPTAAPEPTATSTPAQPTPIPTPTPYVFDPYSPPNSMTDDYDLWKVDYDAWKAQKKANEDALEAQEEAREDEWEMHEDDADWVAAHGGGEAYYVSGQWQRDEDAKAAAAAAAEEEARAANSFLAEEAALAQASQCSSAPVLEDDPDVAALGGGSVNGSATSTSSQDVAVSNQNCADLTDQTSASGISGENSILNTDGSVSMNTGDVNGSGQVANQANTNITDVGFLADASASAGDSLAEGNDAENFSTSDDSDNLASATVTENLSVDNSNQAYVDNQLSVEGVSGSNTLSDNDGGVELTTGDIQLIANLLNILNLNVTGDDFLHLIVNIFGQLNGTMDLEEIATALGYQDEEDLEVLARNENTGDDSNNTAEASSEKNTEITNDNQAEVNNDINVTGVSGNNTVEDNDGEVDILTGRITVLANMMNFINANFSGEKWSFIMVNIFGSLTGDIIVPGTDQYLDGEGASGSLAQNYGNGDDSVNDQTASSSQTDSVSGNNSVSLSNNINANGVTGENSMDGNDGPNQEATAGNVDVASTITNFLNMNFFGDNWVFLIVNVFGKWMGQIVGFADEGAIDAPEEGSFAALSVGGSSGPQTATAINGNTGDDSANYATANSSENNSVDNANSAVVNNNINVDAISGGNQANGNQGSTKIKSGWVEIDANLLNIINMNVTGRQWMIVFLNIFGDMTGNLFFGAPPAPAAVIAETGETATAQNNTNNGSNPDSNSDSSNSNNQTGGVVTTNSRTGSSNSDSDQKQAAPVSFSESTNDDDLINVQGVSYPKDHTEVVVTQNSNLLSLLIGWLSDIMYSKLRYSVQTLLAHLGGELS